MVFVIDMNGVNDHFACKTSALEFQIDAIITQRKCLAAGQRATKKKISIKNVDAGFVIAIYLRYVFSLQLHIFPTINVESLHKSSFT